MPYYHIKILKRKPNSPDSQADFEIDMLEEQVNAVAEQYQKEDAIFLNGSWVKINELEQIEIRETPQKTSYYYPQLKIETIFLTPSYPNVTRKFIKLPPKEQAVESEKVRKHLSKVFIVHGTDYSPVNELKAILEEVGLKPIVLHEQPSRGMTLIEKLEKYSDVGFAFIILTPDDLGVGKKEAQKLLISAIGKENVTSDDIQKWYSGNSITAAITTLRMFEMFRDRARQNVVLEFGYFMGLLKRDRVCCLYKGGIELPSDMHGIAYVPFKDSVKEIKQKILEELRAAGYEVI